MTGRPDLAPARRILRSKARVDVSLAPYCTYRVGGDAALWIDARTVGDLQLVRRALAEVDCPVLIVGKGSNMLVADAGFAGIAIHLGDEFAGIEVDEDEPLVTAGGAALLPVVARQTAAAALTGFEWAVGVPGSIGGAVRMNAGGHGSDMAASLVSAGVFDLRSTDPAEEVRRWSLDDLELGYRVSAIRPWQIVVDARLRLEPGDRTESEAEISEIVRWRRANQPGGQNAGSVFANPPGDSAGRLIDSLGLKGLRIGTATVSEKHANFIQAEPDGSADDVYRLILDVQRRVLAETGIELQPENKLIGFESITPTEVARK